MICAINDLQHNFKTHFVATLYQLLNMQYATGKSVEASIKLAQELAKVQTDSEYAQGQKLSKNRHIVLIFAFNTHHFLYIKYVSPQ